jgi:SAM-dependent methyltransferase
MKQIIKKSIPRYVWKLLSSIYLHIDANRNTNRTAKEVFTKIYLKDMSSGLGSSTKHITLPYVKMVTNFMQSFDKKPSVVDLGCGDFQVGKHFIDYCAEYIGVDVVSDLIEQHKTANYGDHVKFICSDITEDKLPEGDICLLRQVLQHLSNEQIAKILPKLDHYRVTFITEHYPTDNSKIVPNKDIIHGVHIRVYKNSAVYLDKPPFNLPSEYLQLVLEVPGIGLLQGWNQGVIRTFKLDFHHDSFLETVAER